MSSILSSQQRQGSPCPSLLSDSSIESDLPGLSSPMDDIPSLSSQSQVGEMYSAEPSSCERSQSLPTSHPATPLTFCLPCTSNPFMDSIEIYKLCNKHFEIDTQQNALSRCASPANARFSMIDEAQWLGPRQSTLEIEDSQTLPIVTNWSDLDYRPANLPLPPQRPHVNSLQYDIDRMHSLVNNTQCDRVPVSTLSSVKAYCDPRPLRKFHSEGNLFAHWQQRPYEQHPNNYCHVIGPCKMQLASMLRWRHGIEPPLTLTPEQYLVSTEEIFCLEIESENEEGNTCILSAPPEAKVSASPANSAQPAEADSAQLRRAYSSEAIDDYEKTLVQATAHVHECDVHAPHPTPNPSHDLSPLPEPIPAERNSNTHQIDQNEKDQIAAFDEDIHEATLEEVPIEGTISTVLENTDYSGIYDRNNPYGPASVNVPSNYTDPENPNRLTRKGIDDTSTPPEELMATSDLNLEAIAASYAEPEPRVWPFRTRKDRDK